MSRSAEATCETAFGSNDQIVSSAEPARRDCHWRPLVNTASNAMKFSIAFVLGGSCWIGLESLAVKLSQYFLV